MREGSELIIARALRLALRPRLLLGMGRQAASLVLASAREEGWRTAARKILNAPRRHGLGVLARHVHRRHIAATRPPLTYPVYGAPATRPAAGLLSPRVLVVAELGLTQCTKYRVTQKAEHFERLGIPCTILDWTDHRSVRNALPLHPMVIFYRVPGYPQVLAHVEEARRLGAVTFWEVDDLIFDAEAYEANGNLHRLEPAVRDGIRFGIPLYRATLAACDHAIASTEPLAEAMRRVVAGEAFVVENALDAETIRRAEAVRGSRAPSSGDEVAIIYGSGSKAHDADFSVAAEGLLEALQQRPQARLRIIGHLTLPPAFDAVADRVERLPFTDFGTYLEQLGAADISLAPLEATLFNDAKSNIKFLEAAILGLPSVCSPRATFAQVVRDGHNGRLADSPDEWRDALLDLIDDAEARRRLGSAALDTVQALYRPESVARRQVLPLIERFLPMERRPGLRALVANVFFRPQSFGGATIVAEELVERLHRRPDTEVAVFTSYGEEEDPYELFRYETEGVPVFAAKMPPMQHRELDYMNARMGELFAEVLAAWRPDVVHLHSVQGLSASVTVACERAGVPYVITLHDAWWVCERQFMVMGDGKYCFQTRIDLNVCARCVPDSWFNKHRQRQLRRVLDGAALLLTPSAFHRRLHLANDVEPDRIAVNRNGVRWPDAGWPARRIERPPGTVRFGFVGGVGPIKGYELIKAAFEEIKAANYKLVLVDNTLNLGFSSLDPRTWRARGTVTVVPAYTQDTMDEFFGRIDVLLFPSQWKESFGLTVREALTRDVWTIVTEAGGASEDVVDGENGTIIPITEDHGPLKRAILDLLEEPERLAGFVNPHKSRIATFDSQAEELHRCLRAVARGGRPSGPDSAEVAQEEHVGEQRQIGEREGDHGAPRAEREPHPVPITAVTG